MIWESEEFAQTSAALSLEPVIVLPAQILQGRRGDAELIPEKNLMLAVLEDAIKVFQRKSSDRRVPSEQARREAEAWIVSSDTRWWFSFENICHALEIDVEYMRSGLMALMQKRDEDGSLKKTIRVIRARASCEKRVCVGEPKARKRHRRTLQGDHAI